MIAVMLALAVAQPPSVFRSDTDPHFAWGCRPCGPGIRRRGHREADQKYRGTCPKPYLSRRRTWTFSRELAGCDIESAGVPAREPLTLGGKGPKPPSYVERFPARRRAVIEDRDLQCKRHQRLLVG